MNAWIYNTGYCDRAGKIFAQQILQNGEKDKERSFPQMQSIHCISYRKVIYLDKQIDR